MTSLRRVSLLFGALLASGLLLSGSTATVADGPPAAPSDLRWVGLLRWTDNSDNEVGFKVLRSVGGQTPEVWAILPANSTSAETGWGSFEDQCAGIRFTVVAFNDAGESAPSNGASSPPPRFGCPFIRVFERGSGPAAIALMFGYRHGIAEARLVSNAPGCPEPEISPKTVRWPVPCVDAGESVMIEFVANGPLVPEGYSWVTPIPGDVNCDGALESVDALFVLRDVAGMSPLSACGLFVGDTDLDGDIDSADAHRVLATVAGFAVTT